jgi:HD-like signal output (HDOD) protein
MKPSQQFIGEIVDKISMPDIYQKISKLMASRQAKIEDYEQLIKTDNLLAVRIMRIAHSEFFGFNQQSPDLYEAIGLIGIIQLHDLLVCSIVLRTFSAIPETILNYDAFWRHSISCGIAARRIARFCRLPANNRYFSLGLLLNVGHAAMFIKAPDLTLNVLEQSQTLKRPIAEMERDYFGFDYCELGAELMRQWHLPNVYQQVIANHLQPDQSNPDLRLATEILHFAHQFCEESTSEMLNPQRVNAALFGDFPQNFAQIINNEIKANVDNIFTMLRPPCVHHLQLDAKEIAP